jgi:dTDP-4-amino-4,6-dideoxygalactose transaminase
MEATLGQRVEVPLLDLRPQYHALRGEIDAAIARVVESQHFILGPEVEQFEREIAAYCGAPDAVGVGSGSDAILLALMAHGIGPGDQVICPTYTFFATAGCVARVGAEPVFADVDPATLNVTPEDVERAARRCRRLRALLPVHLFGRSADLDGLAAVASRLGVPLIEDAAQAIGAADARGRRVGSAGPLACFSFFPTKNLGGFGEGGLVTCHDADVADVLRTLRVHGMKPRYRHRMVGVNARLDALQAAVLRVKLGHLEGWHAARARNAARYQEHFAKAGAAPADVPLDEGGIALRFPTDVAPPGRHVFNQYVIRVRAERRDALRAQLAEAGIGSEVYYPIPLHLQECFRDLGGREGDFPVSEAAARETLALPIHPDLSDLQVDTVAAAILEFLQGDGVG